MSNIALPDRLRALQTNLSTRFQSLLGQYKPTLGMLFDEETSTDRTQLYTWPTRNMRVRKWLGDRVVNGADAFVWEVENETWELTFGAKREDVEDDKFNIWDSQLRQITNAIDVHLDDFAVTLLQNTTTQPCYDLQQWWSTTHPVNPKDAASATFSNLFTSTELTAANFEARYYAGMTLNGHDGLPLGIKYTHIVVPPQLAGRAKRIIESDFAFESTAATNAAATSNPNKGLVEIVISPRLANEGTVWYLADLSQPVKPFIHQTRRPFELHTMFDPSSPTVFRENVFEFGIDGRDAATVTIPQLMCRCIQ